MPTKLMKQHPDSRQAQSRAIAVWFDQHRDSAYRNAAGDKLFEYGRPWWSVIEKASGMPSGPVYPMGWQAPWLPPQQYVTDSIGRIPKQEFGNTPMPRGVNSDRFRIAYDRMAQDDRDATRSHYELAVTVAHNKNLPVPKWGAPMDSRLIVIVGIPPRNPKIAEAASSGDKWLLGQAMPKYNPVTGKHEIEENEELARLLRMHNSHLWTPEQAERDAEAVERDAEAVERNQSEVRALFEEMVAMKKEMEALRGVAPVKNKGGRTRKSSQPAPAGAE